MRFAEQNELCAGSVVLAQGLINQAYEVSEQAYGGVTWQRWAAAENAVEHDVEAAHIRQVIDRWHVQFCNVEREPICLGHVAIVANGHPAKLAGTPRRQRSPVRRCRRLAD
jgi:hypothetical protein